MLAQQAPDQEPDLRLSATATPMVVRQTLRHVEGTLQKWGLPAADRSNTQLVLGEILNNIAEHAYAGQPDGSFQLAVNLKSDRLSVVISDAGKPLPNGHLPIGSPPNVDGATDTLPEGGYGWFIVHTLTEGLDYQRLDDRNILSFHIMRK